ncbi:hypothetical protein TRFO_12040 [Tritrichomonas foetus]|uniref:Uncharacterized protein n=1 Tax=Tritrichomonas foetus TaxID=1144522 RepID=A0A1J4J770_9EUKA|nr:hypothetical protein TRFO_12040 [Tritrichomonas foetus]|eukprot:OHS93044.1 hypothetical protein TRFO_12040 [Tritrichomonas foetus]
MKSQNKLFSNGNMFNNTLTTSSDSINKDSIIDQMQEKIGELLHTNEELCNVKNQLEMQKEKNITLQTQLDHERQLSQQKIAQMDEENTEKSEIIAELKMQINELTKNKEFLEGNINQLEKKVDEINQNSDNKIIQQVSYQTGELKATIESRNQEIKELKTQIQTLKEKHSSSNEEINKSRIENERLQASKFEKEREIQQCKEEIKKLRNKFTGIKERHQKEKENNQKLMIDLNDCQNEILKYKQKEEISRERIEKLEKDLKESDSLINQVLALSPGFSNIDNALKYFVEKVDECQILKQELKSQRRTLKKFAFAIQKYESKLEMTQKSSEKVKSTNTALLNKCEEQQKQINLLKNNMERYQRRISILPVYENINSELKDRLNDIIRTIHPDVSELTFRNLMVFVIMLKRWKTLPGTQHNYVKDSRNWWWMNHNESQKLTGNDIINNINNLKDEIEKSRIHAEDLKLQNERYQNELQTAKLSAEKTDQMLKSDAEKIADLENQIADLQKASETKISSETLTDLSTKLSKTKKKLMNARLKLKENDLEISNLQVSLSQTKQQYNHQCILTKQHERSLENTKYQLYNAQNGIITLQQGNNMKTKEILALERGIAKEHRSAITSQTQNTVLNIENRRLNFQVSRQNKLMTMSPPDHQSVELSPK